MACANWFHTTTVSHALIPTLRLRGLNFSASLRRFSTAGKFIPAPTRSRPSIITTTVHAQARRVSPFKEGQVATPADLDFKTPLKILEYPNPILRAKSKRIGTFDDGLKKLVDEMFDLMYQTDGIGLSAPQVGVNVKLMVFNPVGEPGEGEEIILINPTVINYSKKLVLFDEGCLSFPGIYADIQRPESVKISASDITGAKFEVSLSGLPARIFQHEFDHLQGTLFFDRMTEEVLDSISEKLQALEKKYEDITGFPSPERIEARKKRKEAAGFGKA